MKPGPKPKPKRKAKEWKEISTVAVIPEIVRINRESEYKVEYCQQLIDHMAQGFSFQSFSAVINMPWRVLYSWRKRHEEFEFSYQVGRGKMLLYWEKILILIATGKLEKGNAKIPLSYIQMVFRDIFDKPEEISETTVSQLSDTELRQLAKSAIEVIERHRNAVAPPTPSE